jgi:hypothetical protein
VTATFLLRWRGSLHITDSQHNERPEAGSERSGGPAQQPHSQSRLAVLLAGLPRPVSSSSSRTAALHRYRIRRSPCAVHIPFTCICPRRRERHRYRVDPQQPTSLPLPFTCCSACLPCHSWPCEPAAPICSLTLAFSSSQSEQNIFFHLSALPQSWPTIHATPVTMQAAPTKKRRRSTDDDAEGQSEPVDKVCKIGTLKTLISGSLTSNSESTSHPGLILELGLSMATSGFLQQPISVLPLSAEQV